MNTTQQVSFFLFLMLPSIISAANTSDIVKTAAIVETAAQQRAINEQQRAVNEECLRLLLSYDPKDIKKASKMVSELKGSRRRSLEEINAAGFFAKESIQLVECPLVKGRKRR